MQKNFTNIDKQLGNKTQPPLSSLTSLLLSFRQAEQASHHLGAWELLQRPLQHLLDGQQPLPRRGVQDHVQEAHGE